MYSVHVYNFIKLYVNIAFKCLFRNCFNTTTYTSCNKLLISCISKYLKSVIYYQIFLSHPNLNETFISIVQ